MASELAELRQRVEALERMVFEMRQRHRAPKTPRSRAPYITRDDWKWCTRPGCTKGSYKSNPVCRTCAGWDPRLGDYPPDHPRAQGDVGSVYPKTEEPK